MYQQVPIGRLVCDFLSELELLAQCESWLQSDTLHHIVTLNPEMVVLADKNRDFARAAAQADRRVPDGAGLFWAKDYLAAPPNHVGLRLWKLLSQRPPRVTGVASVTKLAALCAAKKMPLYLLGGAPAANRGTAEVLRRRWPDLKVFSAPDHVFSMAGPAAILRDIAAKQPAVLLVAYGAPRQTLWIEEYRHQLSSVRLALGVGGAFTMIAGAKPRAPKFLQALNLEWLWRLCLEPRRLGRIYNAVIVFPRLVRKQKQNSGIV